jgi:C-terminal processing protease CtpA/Prc
VLLSSLRHGGPAEQSGCIFTGNLVISINGRSMDGVSLDQVVNILGEGDWGTVVNVGIMRLRGTKGALPDQNITTVVALRRGLRQMSSVTSPPVISIATRCPSGDI